MQNSFFEQLFNCLDDNYSMQISITKSKGKLVVVALPVTTNNEINSAITPTAIRATPEELDKDFINEITKPLQTLSKGISEHERLDEIIKTQLKNKEEKVKDKKASEKDISTATNTKPETLSLFGSL